jgi:predicted alpha/beta-hydrolase family hydrolase
MAAARSPLILFAHGAGAPSHSGWMVAWADRLRSLGEVVTFDYPYMAAGRKSPDKPPVLLAAHRKALDEAQARHGSNRPVVLAGKSMGSRMGCHLAVELAREGRAPAALVCFGYPLRAGGSGSMRDAVLRELTTPILFLTGSKDPLCPLPDLQKVQGELTTRNELYVVDGGDHSLDLRRKTVRPGERSQQQWNQAVLEVVARFLGELGVGGAAR